MLSKETELALDKADFARSIEEEVARLIALPIPLADVREAKRAAEARIEYLSRGLAYLPPAQRVEVENEIARRGADWDRYEAELVARADEAVPLDAPLEVVADEAVPLDEPLEVAVDEAAVDSIDRHPQAGRGRRRETKDHHPEVREFLDRVKQERGGANVARFIDFCNVSDYSDDTILGAWRRGDTKRCSPAQAAKFERTLKLSPVEFIAKIEELRSATINP